MGNSALVTTLKDHRLVAKFQALCGVRIVIPDRDQDETKNYTYTEKFLKDGYYPSCSSSHKDNQRSSITSKVYLRRIPSLQTDSLAENESPPELVVKTFFIIDLFFRFASELGYEPFYITVMPFFIWNIDAYVGRLVIMLWCFSMYVGQAIKPLVRWPRPPSPPVVRLEQNPIVEMEYGFPSTHATVCTTLPFYTLYLAYNRYELYFIPAFTVALIWCTSVSLSRIYVGVHSFIDLVGGISVSVVIYLLSSLFLESTDKFLMASPVGPLIALLAVILMLFLYPVEKGRWSIDRGDTAAILGVGLGVFTGCWLSTPMDDILTGPFPIKLFSYNTLVMSFVRFVVGILVVVPTRFIMKMLCFKILPVIMPTNGVEEVRRRPLVEIPYKIITYTSIGFNIAYLSPLVFSLINISRHFPDHLN